MVKQRHLAPSLMTVTVTGIYDGVQMQLIHCGLYEHLWYFRYDLILSANEQIYWLKYKYIGTYICLNNSKCWSVAHRSQCKQEEASEGGWMDGANLKNSQCYFAVVANQHSQCQCLSSWEAHESSSHSHCSPSWTVLLFGVHCSVRAAKLAACGLCKWTDRGIRQWRLTDLELGLAWRTFKCKVPY